MTEFVLLLLVLLTLAATTFAGAVSERAGERLAAARTPASWVRLILRSSAAALTLSYGAAKAWHASADLASSLRWWLGGTGVALLLPFLVSIVAGIWFLLRLGPHRLDSSIRVAGHTGQLREIGLTRLALVADREHIVLLPYLPLAWQPLAVAPPAAIAESQIRLEREAWSEDLRKFLLQAAILSPYRDVTSPVSVSVSGGIANVSVTLVRPEAAVLFERALLCAVDELERRRLEVTNPEGTAAAAR